MLSTPVFPTVVEKSSAEPESSSSAPSAPPAQRVDVLGSMRRLSIHGVKPEPEQVVSKTDPLPEYGEQGDEGLTPAALARLWGAYLAKLREAKVSGDYYSSMKDVVPQIQDDGSTVLFTFPTRYDLQAFEKLRLHIEGYLQHKLQRSDVVVRGEKSEQGEARMEIMPKEQYFEELLKENPALAELMRVYEGRLS